MALGPVVAVTAEMRRAASQALAGDSNVGFASSLAADARAVGG
jgi:hypothetical protein